MTLQPPRGLTPAARASWRHARDVLFALGEDPRLSAGALDRYASAVDTVTRLRGELRGQGLVLVGPRGGVRVHPLVRAVERAEREASMLAEALALTPMARRKLGRSVRGGRPAGAASAADRVVVVPLRRTPRGEP